MERQLQRPELTHQSNNAHLIRFRSGKEEMFKNMLLRDAEFKPLCSSYKITSVPLLLQPSKVITLVRANQYLYAVSSLASRKLKRYNVSISESEVYLMDQVLMRMASKARPRNLQPKPLRQTVQGLSDV